MTKIRITPITPNIGAEVSNIDLSGRLNPATLSLLRDAFLSHLVLVFRDQQLDREQHKNFARNFGDIHIHPSHRRGMNKHEDPEIFIIDTRPDARMSNGEAWHSDVSCEEMPPMASLLYVSKTPENGGGDTMFANMYEAYGELSEDLKRLLADKVAVHDGEMDLRNYGIKLKAGQRYPSATHPVIVRHPETDKPLLLVNPSFTSHIEALPRWESRMVLEGLHDFVAKNARLHCRISWTPGTLVMWDNRCAQHQAIRDYAGYSRYGERVSILDHRQPVQYQA